MTTRHDLGLLPDPDAILRSHPVRVTRHGKGWALETELYLALPRAEVFPFFADAHNLEAITPPLLGFRVLTPQPIKMREGVLIDYKLRIRGVPVSWRTEIQAWEPDTRFIDNQLKGPYTRWHHTHVFEEVEGGTRCLDRVEYEVPGGPFAPMVHAIAVKRDVVSIFRYRASELMKRLDPRGKPAAQIQRGS